uniref:G_PROTEIN_RECEP_F1_2 domain-containing protein n=1 Tax=Rhabditophanes sp. KR3021 TaxID=114890 RepID=A0AC35UAX1_9BILA
MRSISCTSSTTFDIENSTFLTYFNLFAEEYGKIHVPLAISICFVGTFLNVLTVIILTRPLMHSPVNMLLSLIAICDIITMVSTFIFTMHFEIMAVNRCDISDYSYMWSCFMFAHSHITVIFHSVSIWLTVSLAQIRLFTIKKATLGPTIFVNTWSTCLLGLCTLIVMVVVDIPNFMTFSIRKYEIHEYSQNFCFYIENVTEIVTDQQKKTAQLVSEWKRDSVSWYFVSQMATDCYWEFLAYWLNGAICKIVPCFMLTISIIALLKMIRDVGIRRKKLAEVS